MKKIILVLMTLGCLRLLQGPLTAMWSNSEEDSTELSLGEMSPEEVLQETLDSYKKTVAYASDPLVKALQQDLVNHDKRNIVQVRSLDQMEKEMRDQYGLKCGFFVVYNLMQIGKLLDQHADMGPFDITNPLGKAVLGTQEDFKTWMNNQEEYILEAITADPGLGAYEKIDAGSSGSTGEDVELSAGHIIALMARQTNFSLERQKMLGLLEYELNDLGSADVTGQVTTLQSILDGAVQYPAGDNIYQKIQEFRQKGAPLFMVYLKALHWRIFVMTKQGMYTANSYENVPQVDDVSLRGLYDFFLIGPMPEAEKKPEVVTTQSGPLELSLAKVRDALGRLRNNLTSLKEKLNILAQKVV